MRFSLLKGNKIPIIKLGTPRSIIPHTVLTITQQPSSVTLFEEETATFTVSGFAVPDFNVNYQWQTSLNKGLTYTDINGATSRIFSISASTSLNDSLLRCRLSASNVKNPNFTSSAVLSVLEFDKFITITKDLLSSIETVSDYPFTFICTASATNNTKTTVNWESLDFPFTGQYTTIATDTPVLSTLILSRGEQKRLRARVFAEGADSILSNVSLLCSYTPNLSTNFIPCSAVIDRAICAAQAPFFESTLGQPGWSYGFNNGGSWLGYTKAPDNSNDARIHVTLANNSSYNDSYVSWGFSDLFAPGAIFRYSVWAKQISGADITTGSLLSVTRNNPSDRVSIPMTGNITREWKRFEIYWTISPQIGESNYSAVFMAENILPVGFPGHIHIAFWGAELNIIGNLPPNLPAGPLTPVSANAVVNIFKLNI